MKNPRIEAKMAWAVAAARSGFRAGVRWGGGVGAVLAGAVAMAAAAGGGAWISLFDGGDLSAWRTYKKTVQDPVGWVVEDGALAWRKGAGNLVTRETYGDFELELEWKISPGGNSGVMIGVEETSERPWHSGPEFQLLDDAAHKDGKNPAMSSGSLYGLYAPKSRAARPVGEWNVQRIKVQAGKIESWLNGTKVVEAQVGSDDWKARVAQSKFGRFPQFATVKEGRILLQDHNDPVWFRKIRIRRL